MRWTHGGALADQRGLVVRGVAVEGRCDRRGGEFGEAVRNSAPALRGSRARSSCRRASSAFSSKSASTTREEAAVSRTRETDMVGTVASVLVLVVLPLVTETEDVAFRGRFVRARDR